MAYDYMCHLDGMKAVPKSSWSSVRKMIDSLDILNQKDKSCREKYDSSTLNTIAAEQTFVWLSRFPKKLCAMPKEHHLFYLHRMVKRA